MVLLGGVQVLRAVGVVDHGGDGPQEGPALGESGITLKFIVEIEEGNIFTVPRILNHDLLLGFRKLGVECPFPQLDVHSC